MNQLSHKEFGAYLIAIGKLMLVRDVPFATAAAPSEPEEEEKLLDSIASELMSNGLDGDRASDVEDCAWHACRSVVSSTVSRLATKPTSLSDPDEPDLLEDSVKDSDTADDADPSAPV